MREYVPAPLGRPSGNGSGAGVMHGARSVPRLWLHALLLALTVLTTTTVGARLAQNFHLNRPAFDIEQDFRAFFHILSHPVLLLDGLPFSLTLLGILLAHEMGHYLACAWHGVEASLPYFLPAPTFIGTFGAFIRIRSPIYSRRILFDIGIAGPIAGFVLLPPAMAIGLAWSRITPGLGERGDLVFGFPPLLRLFTELMMPGVASQDLSLHPVARAACVGALATALNLLPIGQLDGGHILYAFAGERHRTLSRVAVGILVPIGFFYWYGWLVWAAFFLFFGLRHPPTIYDPDSLGPGRLKLGWLALIMLLATFTLAPFESGT